VLGFGVGAVIVLGGFLGCKEWGRGEEGMMGSLGLLRAEVASLV